MSLPPSPLDDSILGPIARIIDKTIADPEARGRARLALLTLDTSQELAMLRASLAAGSGPADPWTSRARPGFLYVMYAMILGALPVGLTGAFSPAAAKAISACMAAYLSAIPEPLYALFGTGYLSYSAMRQWGKVKGSAR